VQDYLYDWAAADALYYYTGRQATLRIYQVDGDQDCPEGDSDLVVPFRTLRGSDG
jgi:hypothetical protein